MTGAQGAGERLYLVRGQPVIQVALFNQQSVFFRAGAAIGITRAAVACNDMAAYQGLEQNHDRPPRSAVALLLVSHARLVRQRLCWADVDKAPA